MSIPHNLKLLFTPVTGVLLFEGIALEYGEGHLASWLTLPCIAGFSLINNRGIYRAFLATLSMAFLHEGLWYFLGNLVMDVEINDLFSKSTILFTYLIFPMLFVSLYAWIYHSALKLLSNVILPFGVFMLIWDAFGFPISTLGQPNAVYWEIGSWLTIFTGYVTLEWKRTPSIK